MTEIKIIPISIQNECALLLPNEPFSLMGKLNVIRTKVGWHHEEELFEETDTQVFPNENYKLEEINKNGFAIGAFVGDQCIGLATFEEQWNKFLYLADLKVNGNYRRQGIAKKLLHAAKPIAVKRGCERFSTIA